MLKLKKIVKTYAVGSILCVIFLATSALAVPVRFPSGRVVELTASQVELLKQQPGITYILYNPEVVSPGLRVVKLPEELGGGFLVGVPNDLVAGLVAIGAVGKITPETIIGSGPSFLTRIMEFAEVEKIEAELGFDVGYRVDNFDWNIAGDLSGNNPNILSELTWEDLQIFQVKVAVKTILDEALYLRGSFAYGWIFAGDNQDSDFAGDNRTFEFSRSNSNSDEDNTLDTSLGIGYQFTFELDNFRFIPLVGYSYHEQNLTMTDGLQTLSQFGFPVPVGTFFPDLHSTYEGEWKGPWVGFDMIIIPSKKLTMLVTFEYHWADYYAVADWNLRTDFAHPKSFEHDADGSGILVSGNWNYSFTKHWSMNVNFAYQTWFTDPGIDRTFFADGTTAETRLNEVNWESYSIALGATYRF